MLSIQLLGPPLIFLDDRPLAITRKKSRALLYYLAAHDKPLTREQFLAVFWPDRDRASAQQVLRTTLHGLRQALGAALVTADNTLSLAPDTDIDVRTFEVNLRRPRGASDFQLLTSTLQLLSQRLPHRFSLSDSAEFDDWLTAQQSTIGVWPFAASSRWRTHEQRQDYQAALAALDRALAFDPLHEDAQRSALRVHTSRAIAPARSGAMIHCANCWTKRWVCRPWPKRARCTTRLSGIRAREAGIGDRG
jgi:DNA-binding SARP family transcriptional activator